MNNKYKFLLAGHIVVFALNVLMLIFCASHFIVGNENKTGIQLISAPNNDLIATTLSISIVLFIASISVLAIISFCLLLSDFEIIEAKATLNMLKRLQMVFAFLIIILAFIILICLRLKTDELNRGQSTQNQLGIGSVINFVFSIVVLAESFALNFVDYIKFKN